MRNDREVVLEAIKHHFREPEKHEQEDRYNYVMALDYAGEELRNDKDFMSEVEGNTAHTPVRPERKKQLDSQEIAELLEQDENLNKQILTAEQVLKGQENEKEGPSHEEQ